MSSSEAAQRVTDLEIHVAHQEMVITELSETVRRQWAEIDALKTRLAFVFEHLRTARDEGGGLPADQRPPHW